MAAADDLVAYLDSHDRASLTDVVGAMLRNNSLEETIRAAATLSATGFVAYECSVNLSLTPQGRVLVQALEKRNV